MSNYKHSCMQVMQKGAWWHQGWPATWSKGWPLASARIVEYSILNSRYSAAARMR
jgi:hypothetical protein